MNNYKIDKNYVSGELHTVVYYDLITGNISRHDGPAKTEFYLYSNGKKFTEAYYVNGIMYNPNGPSYIIYDRDGSISKETFTDRHGNKIKIKTYDYERLLRVERFNAEGQLHCETGPSYTLYKSCKNEVNYYYYEGTDITDLYYDVLRSIEDNDFNNFVELKLLHLIKKHAEKYIHKFYVILNIMNNEKVISKKEYVDMKNFIDSVHIINVMEN